MTVIDPEFLGYVSALAEFVRSLESIRGVKIDPDLLGIAERVRCDVHDIRRGLEIKAEQRELRDRVKRQTFAGMR